jgi:hypothetical protein
MSAAPRKSSLQALLDRQMAPEPRDPAPEPKPAAQGLPAKPKFTRPSREGTRFVGGHFAPKVAKALKLLAVEEDTSTQALLEEAIDLLFVKKGKGRVVRPDPA